MVKLPAAKPVGKLQVMTRIAGNQRGGTFLAADVKGEMGTARREVGDHQKDNKAERRRFRRIQGNASWSCGHICTDGRDACAILFSLPDHSGSGRGQRQRVEPSVERCLLVEQGVAPLVIGIIEVPMKVINFDHTR